MSEHVHDWHLITTYFSRSLYLARCTRCGAEEEQPVLVVPALPAGPVTPRTPTKKGRKI
jgi:hypothetical protein